MLRVDRREDVGLGLELPKIPTKNLREVEASLGVSFRDPSLLAMALVHSSHSNEPGAPSNERLEFLGDAVIGMIVAEWLYKKFPEATEGDMTIMRSAAVSRKALAAVGRRQSIHCFMVLGKGEEARRGHLSDALIGGVVEALAGAVLVDSGLAKTRPCVIRMLQPDLKRLRPGQGIRDAKSRLQQLAQARLKITPRYRIDVDSLDEGRPHMATVFVGDRELGSARARRRRDAEQAAATQALATLEAELAEDSDRS